MAIGGFLALSLAAAGGWGLVLWYAADRVRYVRELAFRTMTYVPWTLDEARASLLAALYLVTGIVLTAAFAYAFGVPLWGSLAPSSALLATIVLGVVAEISVTDLLVTVMVIPVFGRNRFAELSTVPWIEGVNRLPAGSAAWAAASAGAVEELFFRGVLLRICVQHFGMAWWLALTAVTVLFLVQQLVQIRSAFQAAVIGAGCLTISVVGGMLVLTTGSAVPAVAAHAAFVLFFMRRRTERPATVRPAH